MWTSLVRITTIKYASRKLPGWYAMGPSRVPPAHVEPASIRGNLMIHVLKHRTVWKDIYVMSMPRVFAEEIRVLLAIQMTTAMNPISVMNQQKHASEAAKQRSDLPPYQFPPGKSRKLRSTVPLKTVWHGISSIRTGSMASL